MSGDPAKPGWLSEDASREWDRLIRELGGPNGILASCDGGVLLVACDAYAMLCEARRVLAQAGPTYKTRNAEGGIMIRQRPEVRILERARGDYLRALCELGASPSQHARVQPLPSGDTPDDRDSGIHKFFRPGPNRG